MAFKRLAVNKSPGDPGFVDELNEQLSAFSEIAGKVLRVDLRSQAVTPGKSIAITHSLGVKPDFLWAWESPSVGTDVPAQVSAAELATWSSRTVRFTPAASVERLSILIIALT